MTSSKVRERHFRYKAWVAIYAASKHEETQNQSVVSEVGGSLPLLSVFRKRNDGQIFAAAQKSSAEYSRADPLTSGPVLIIFL